MAEKFEEVPVEDGTKILFEHQLKFGDYDVIYQKWSWDGITAESLIFDSKDVRHLKDSELKTEVLESPLVDANTTLTLSRSDSDYTFVSFNFKS